MWPLVATWTKDFSTDPDMMFRSSLGLDVTMAPGGGRGIRVML